MKEAICKKCKFVYFSNEIPVILECFCGNKEFKVNELQEVKKEVNEEVVEEVNSEV